jgi:hypothetical protein
LGRETQRLNLSDRLDTIHSWHPNIHHQHIRYQTLRQFEHRLTILSLTHNLDIAGLDEQGADSLSYKVVVVG